MQNRARLNGFECSRPGGGSKITLIVREVFDPKSNNPAISELSSAVVVSGGSQFYHDNCESDASFWASVNDAHLQVHGVPIDGQGAGLQELTPQQVSSGAIQ